MKISLSILTVDFFNIEKALEELVLKTDYLHMDVMDGCFVPNLSFGPQVVSSLNRHLCLPLDTHLMVTHPKSYVEAFAKAGSRYITFHVESEDDVLSTIDEIRRFGALPGIALKPKTEIQTILPYLPLVDMVLIMSVEPGFGGQSFQRSAVYKAKQLFELKKEKNYSYLINIDGGINDQTLPLVSSYVDLAVSGSYVLNSSNPLENLLKLKSID